MFNHYDLLFLCFLLGHMTTICLLQFVFLLCATMSHSSPKSHRYHAPISSLYQIKSSRAFSAQPWSVIEGSLHLSVSLCHKSIAFQQTYTHILLSFMSVIIWSFMSSLHGCIYSEILLFLSAPFGLFHSHMFKVSEDTLFRIQTLLRIVKVTGRISKLSELWKLER